MAEQTTPSSGAERLAAVLRAPQPVPPTIGAEQTPRTFRMGVVTVVAPLTVKFNDDPLATVAGIPSIGYVGVVGDLVVVAVFEGGSMVVLGSTSHAGVQPWKQPWGVLSYTLSGTPLDSSANNAAGLIVFPTIGYVNTPGRVLRASWHASYVSNLDAGNNQFIVQFCDQNGAILQNACVGNMPGSAYRPLTAWMMFISTGVGPGLQMRATGSAAAAFRFQTAGYNSYLSIEDMGPA